MTQITTGESDNKVKIDETLERFLHQGQMYAYLATNDRDGYPHVVPIWYLYEDGRFYFTTQTERQKFKNIERDNRVTVCIAKPEEYRILMIKGRIQPLREEIETWVRRLAERYHPPERVEAVVQRLMTPTRINLVLQPEKIIKTGSGWASS